MNKLTTTLVLLVLATSAQAESSWGRSDGSWCNEDGGTTICSGGGRTRSYHSDGNETVGSDGSYGYRRGNQGYYNGNTYQTQGGYTYGADGSVYDQNGRYYLGR